MGKLFFIGDSITAGAWDPKGGWAARIIGEIMRMNIEQKFEDFYCLPYNLGISGDKIPDVLARIDSEIDARLWKEEGAEPKDFADIVISIGVNDSIYMVEEDKPSFTDEEFDKNVKALIAKAQKLSNHIVFLGILPVIETLVCPMPWAPNKAYYNDIIKRYEMMVKQNCDAQNIPFFPLFERWSAQDNLSELLIDGVHPSEQGHEQLAKEISPLLLNDIFIKRHSL